MAEWKQAEWRKSFRRGIRSESLIGIGPNARALFWTLFTCAWWDEESPEGRLLNSPDPTDAKSIEDLGAMSDLTQGQARTALDRLRKKHVADVDDHGVVILPAFKKWQRSESYERVKKLRASRYSNGSATREADSRQQTAETPVAPKGARRRPAKQVDSEAERVLQRVDEHRARLGLAPMGEGRTDTTILARLRDGVSPDKLIAVVDAFGRLADRDPSKRTLLCATTPFTAPRGDKPGGFAWGLSLLDGETSRPPPSGGGSLLSIAEIRANEAEEDAHATR